MVRPLLIRWPIDWRSGGPNPGPLLSVKETQTDIYISCFFMTGWGENGCHRSWLWGVACKGRCIFISEQCFMGTICYTKGNRVKLQYSGCSVSSMSLWWVRNLAAQNKRCSLRATGLPKNPPRRCKQDKSPNLILSVLTYWEWKTLLWIKHPYTTKKPQRPSTCEVLLSFSSNYNPHLATTEDIPVPNNVAEELSSKLPAQIGSAASTQLGLKYGNCSGHYGAVAIVTGRTLEG